MILFDLQFMQRSALKEEKKKKIDDDNANFTPSPGSVSKKWYRFFLLFLLDVNVLSSSNVI